MKVSKEMAILKLVIDLIKVDSKICKEEVAWADTLSRHYRYTPEELRLVHNITLHDALITLQQLDVTQRNEVIALLKEIISIDNHIDRCERILLAAILLAMQENTSHRVQILTVNNSNLDNYDGQLLYLEQKPHPATTEAIKRNYTSLERQLKGYEIDFFFLPQVAQLFTQSHPYITPAIELLFPTFSEINGSEKQELIKNCTTTDFGKYIHRLMGTDTEPFRFDSFLMMKIQSNRLNNNHTTDFLCLDCAQQPIETIELLLDTLAIEPIPQAIPYTGYYRTFFDMISEQSKQNYDLYLIGDRFYLQGHNRIELNISGCERKTLFALFLIHGQEGISNNAFTYFEKDSTLWREIINLYRYFANEKAYNQLEDALRNNQEPGVIANIRDITKRNSHIGYIKRAFTAITTLKSPELYYPQNIKGEYTYNIILPQDRIYAQRISDTGGTPLSIDFFKK